jgi:hypothetical protein
VYAEGLVAHRGESERDQLDVDDVLEHDDARGRPGREEFLIVTPVSSMETSPSEVVVAGSVASASGCGDPV